MTSLPMPDCWPEALRAVPNIGSAALDLHHLDLHIEDEQFLLRAFRSFAEAAGSLERSYSLLRAEVERLRRELETSNSDLAVSLEENRGMRVHLDRILEGLPCGVLVAAGDGPISRVNPEALRLLGLCGAGPAAGLDSLSSIPADVRQLLECARAAT